MLKIKLAVHEPPLWCDMEYNPDIHHRRTIRRKGYDYARQGAYYVTVCGQDRGGMFGEVVDNEMRLNEFGRIAADAWRWLAEHYSQVELGAWVVMPNHLHGILVITDSIVGGGENTGRGGSRTALAESKTLGRIIGAYKTVSTKKINILRGMSGAIVWQRNYYEHIIRNRTEWDRIRDYIAMNPRRWAEDRENPDASKEKRFPQMD